VADLPLHIAILDAAIRRTTKRREELKEQMAAGVDDRRYAQLVGAAREAASLIAALEELRRAQVEGVEDDEEQEGL